MASIISPTQYQQPAFKAAELTPPPSPGNQAADSNKYEANSGKLRRHRVPQNLSLVGSNYNALSKYMVKAESQDHQTVTTIDAGVASPTALKTSTSLAAISPLTTDFDINEHIQISRPDSAVPPEFRRKEVPVSPIVQNHETPTASNFRSARPTIPVSAYSAKSPSRSNTVNANNLLTPRLPPLNTSFPSPSLRHSASTKHNSTLQKALPPPPPKDPSPQRTIAPVIDPDDLPMPETFPKTGRRQGRMLRTVQSIGVLHSGPKTGDSTCTEFRPTTPKSPRSFHRRFFPGMSMFGGSISKGPPSVHSTDTSTPSFTRRLSHLSRNKEPMPQDPLAPVSKLPVMSNQEDVAGGLTYLPRYTNNFAGFCAWKLQLSDPKSFDIKNRNSTRQLPVLKCSKCTFECPLHPQRVLGDRYVWARIPDSRVYSSFGVTYTWQFLFKSHIAQKKKVPKTPRPGTSTHPLIPPLPKPGTAEVEMADGLFACIFCCVQGLGTPIFKGPEALSWHLRSHVDDRIEDVELQHRFKTIVGREPGLNEKFDVHIPDVSKSPHGGASMSVSVGGNGQWEEPSKVISSPEGRSVTNANQNAALRTPATTVPSTPLLHLDIQNEHSWEVKSDSAPSSRDTDDPHGMMWNKPTTLYTQRIH